MRWAALLGMVIAIAAGGCNDCPISSGGSPGLSECPGKDGCGILVDRATDNNNCGKCGNTCNTAAGFLCSNKKCTCAGDTMECDGKCVRSNTENCGRCGARCAAGEYCCGGHCCTPLDNGACGIEGFAVCAGECVSPGRFGWDPENCGACGNACDTANGFSCLDGECGCDSRKMVCDGVCIWTEDDLENCGACGVVCENECLVAVCDIHGVRSWADAGVADAGTD